MPPSPILIITAPIVALDTSVSKVFFGLQWGKIPIDPHQCPVPYLGSGEGFRVRDLI